MELLLLMITPKKGLGGQLELQEEKTGVPHDSSLILSCLLAREELKVYFLKLGINNRINVHFNL